MMIHLSRSARRSALAVLSVLIGGLCAGCGDDYQPASGTTAGAAPASVCPPNQVQTGTPEDRDGDGVSNADETAGYTIVVDTTGLGVEARHLEERFVTSDPDCPDTDGDGLLDGVEVFFKTDPRSSDTDADALSDADEVYMWKTSPTSVDTDGDATGPDGTLAPNPLLFDGSEVGEFGTSPSMADTDGDGKTDFEEIDDPLRSPLVAEVPSVELTITGEVDIRLRVTYAESAGVETTYGKELTTTDSSTTSSTDSTSTATTAAASAGGAGFLKDVVKGAQSGGKKGAATVLAGPVLESRRKAGCDLAAGKAVKLGPIAFKKEDAGLIGDAVGFLGNLSGGTLGPKATLDKTCSEPRLQQVYTVSNSLTRSSTETAQQSYSEYLSESRERTETTSGGSVRVGAQIRNTGPVTVALDDVFITMLQWQQSPTTAALTAGGEPTAELGAGLFRTLATLRPGPLSLTLSPGETSSIIELFNQEVNPDVIKGFLARPNSLIYAPGDVDLLNADGVPFKFLTEKTFGRTASIVIDYGDGRIDRYQVATNVLRDVDGNLLGISMGDVLGTVLGLDYETVEDLRELPGNAPGEFTPVRALQRIGAYSNFYPDPPVNFTTGEPGGASHVWVVYPTREDQADPAIDFDLMRVHHGDEIRIVYTEDLDGDGLYAAEEALYGTSDSFLDEVDNETGTAGPDGRIDGHDSEGDGLFDFFETKIGWVVTIDTPDPNDVNPAYRVFSDPTRSDSDGDGLSDEHEALVSGTDPNNSDTDDDDIPDNVDPLPLRPASRLYVKAEGNPGPGDSWANAITDLRGALQIATVRNADTDPTNDVSEVWVAQGTYPSGTVASFDLGDRVAVYGGFAGDEVTRAARDSNPVTNGTILLGSATALDSAIARILGTGSTLDGFSLIGAVAENHGAALRVSGRDATLRRLYFANNRIREVAGFPMNTVEGFVHSRQGVGGAVSLLGTGGAVFEECTFVGNEAAGGGAVYIQNSGVEFRSCAFLTNVSGGDFFGTAPWWAGGGAVMIDRIPSLTAVLDVAFRDCSFVGNECEVGYVEVAPGAYNEVPRRGGAIRVVSSIGTGFSSGSVFIERCVFDRNTAGFLGTGGGLAVDDGGFEISVTGSRFYENSAYDGHAVWVFDTIRFPAHAPSNFAMTHSTVADNYFDLDLHGNPPGLPWVTAMRLTGSGQTVLNSCIFANERYAEALAEGYRVTDVWPPPSGLAPIFDIRYCCSVESQFIDTKGGPTNLFFTDPEFVDIDAGDLRLRAGSPCVDTGDIFADTVPGERGLQFAGPLDLSGAPRRVDANGDGVAGIDMGAYEQQK